MKILDETGLLACAVYVDLNPIRAALVELLEESDYTSAQRRISALLLEQQQAAVTANTSESPPAAERPDRFLSPLTIDELRDEIGVHLNITGDRCSDKGFLNMSVQSYIELLDWTARRIAPGKRGVTPAAAPAVLERLGLKPTAWCELVENFGELFHLVAGQPTVVDAALSGTGSVASTPHLASANYSIASQLRSPKNILARLRKLRSRPSHFGCTASISIRRSR